MRRYFPVADPNTPNPYPMPGSSRLIPSPEVGEDLFEYDGQAPDYIAAKQALKSRASARQGASRLSQQHHYAALQWAWSHLSQAHRRVAFGDSIPASLTELVDRTQEDLVLLTRRDTQAPAHEAVASYVHVSFPSGWAPETILGKNFEQIHAPVPAHDKFQHDPVGRIHQRQQTAQRTFPRQPLVRFVWTLAADPELDRNPIDGANNDWPRCTQAYFRIERQTSARITDTLAAFLIRVYVYPVETLTPDQRTTLHAAVTHMPDPIAHYKGLLHDRSHILALLE